MKSIFESIYSKIKFNRPGYGEISTTPVTPTSISTMPEVTGAAQSISLAPIEVDQCANLFGWQSQLVNLLQKNEDIYILAGPGGGKTAPIICYWVNNILKIPTNQNLTASLMSNNFMRLLTQPQTIPQVLWLVPIKNLAANIEQEMTERFVIIILQLLNRTCNVVPDPNGGTAIEFTNSLLPIKNIIHSMCSFGNIDKNLILNLIDQSNRVTEKNLPEFKTLLGDVVKNYVRNALIGRAEEGIHTVEIHHKNIRSLKPFIISIYESAAAIISDFSNLKLIVFDEAQRVSGGSEADDQRAAQIGNSIHKVLFDRNGRNAKIVMLSGSTNPNTARNVTQYFNVAYDRNFPSSPYQAPPSVKNPSDIRILPIANLDDRSTQLRIIQTILSGQTLREGGALFIIFGKKRINDIIDQLAPSEGVLISPKPKMEKSKTSLYDTQKDYSQISSPGDPSQISDERLRRAVSNNIAFLYRPEEMTPARQRDTLIVQNLFRAGKIKVILATDAVREGINITCSEIYIPSILLPPDNREMDAGSLTQLINRVGRKAGKYATIYTDKKFVDKIQKALSDDPYRFNEEPFILPGGTIQKIEAGLNYGVKLPLHAARDFYRAFRKAFSI